MSRRTFLADLSLAAAGVITASATAGAAPRTAGTASARTAAGAAAPRTAAGSPRVALGIDVLAASGFAKIRGLRIGLLTNQAGVNAHGELTLDVLRRAAPTAGFRLVRLFAPEHGLYGDLPANAKVAGGRDRRTGLPVCSLYGETRKPTPAMLAGLDALLVDLQDVGARTYTYVSCMKLALEACLEHGVRFIVLDRPNPLGGLKVDGPGLDAKWRSYVGALRVPYVHGLTIGELALAAAQTIGWLDISDAARRRIADAANASAAAATAARAAARAPNTAAIVTAHSAPRPAPPLEVILMRGWRRSMRWRDTGLRWTPTSPRIPHVDSVDFYPITGLGCELDNDFTHGATGRDKGSAGYIWPFRFIRHETRNWATVERALRARRIPGLAFTPLAMRDGTKGILVSITDWQRLRPTELNFHMMQLSCAWAPHGNPFKALPKGKRETFIKHLGSEAFFNALCRDGARLNLTPWLNQWSKNARNFQNWSRQFWLYKT